MTGQMRIDAAETTHVEAPVTNNAMVCACLAELMSTVPRDR
jgi:hypothetical protein